MSGNAMEFCADWFGLDIYETYKANEPVYNPAGPDTNEYNLKTFRGEKSLFFNDRDIAQQITTFRRQPCPITSLFPIYGGFRIVKNITE